MIIILLKKCKDREWSLLSSDAIRFEGAVFSQ